MKMRKCPNKSVGAVITDEYGRHLCLYRKIFPLGLAGIAGHLQFIEGTNILEDWQTALKREVKEEVDLQVINCRIIFQNTLLPNPCQQGYEMHEWTVFKVTAYEGRPVLKEPDKHKWVRFMNIDEIMEYVTRDNADPAWVWIWAKLGLMLLS